MGDEGTSQNRDLGLHGKGHSQDLWKCPHFHLFLVPELHRRRMISLLKHPIKMLHILVSHRQSNILHRHITAL